MRTVGSATGGTIRTVTETMEKTSVYLPRRLKEAVKHAARVRGISEAQVIRDSLELSVASERPKPRGGLFASGDPIAHRVDELLADGFGER